MSRIDSLTESEERINWRVAADIIREDDDLRNELIEAIAKHTVDQNSDRLFAIIERIQESAFVSAYQRTNEPDSESA